MFFFTWLRSAAKAAVLAGVGDAAEELAGGTGENQKAAQALAGMLGGASPALGRGPEDLPDEDDDADSDPMLEKAAPRPRRNGRLSGVAAK